ncbi:hypothetical protein PR202_gb06598 [Eleusine coracana subsp. coracana]|uniref:Receptor kinase-like protein Xa21 n=1 Tax=Eleusine coracana subsp. coracana TaxID=191504 RepID=A0AAV5E9V6_ELECO|nr:hypothetical protein PR202_gb06598 [Eleusine coracana subsp. coracana]
MVLLFLEYLLLAFIFLSCPATYMTHASLASRGSSTPNIADQLALMSFKSRIRSDPSQALVTWGNLSLPICQWRGVACGLRGRNCGRVVALDLAELNLHGTITPALGNLTHLRQLDLSSNRFHGILPAELGNLHDLEILYLYYNSIDGQIPPSLSNYSNLVGFSVYHNKLRGGIPTKLFSLHNLVFLNLGGNFLTGSISSNIGRLVHLKKLNLELNNMTGEIPTEIGSLANLNVLALGLNQFSGAIPSSLGYLSALTFLSIPKNELEGSIPPLQSLSSLNVFELGVNKLKGPIPSWLGNLSSLSTIDLQRNGLVGQIPESLGNLENLTVLSLSDNNLTDTIPHALGNLHTLTKLYLDYNKLEDSFPPSLYNLSSLEILDIQSNNLTGVFPANIGSKLSKLQYFLVSYNEFHGVLPSSLCNASMLQLFEATDNFLHGTIPRCLGTRQKDLATVALAGNQFKATNDADWNFMASLTNCSNMEYIDISSNKLEGPIPEVLGNLTKLSNLDLEVGNLKNLAKLDFSNNKISGEVPASIRIIPEILGSLKGLSSLNLSFNELQGGVPKEGIFLNATAVLINGNDGLCGGVPQLKLPPCSHHTIKKTTPKVTIVVSICSAILFVALVFALSTFYHKRWKAKTSVQRSIISEQYVRVSYAELASATNGFASENLIGAGSFGSVYKGRMRYNDQNIVTAVKVLNLMQRGASQSFIAECETLRCVRHRNLVKILTICSSIDFQGRDFKALVYEFLPNGNLDQWLHKHIMENGEPRALDLITRLRIAIDVASSLDYLHQYKPVPIIHCDLKPSNVLLGSDMVAHVGDFGLARFLHQDTDKSSGWAAMRGSIGYAAPEYGLGNEVSTNGDVYGYGILLLEMFTGKRPTDSEFGETIGLREYVQMALPDRVDTIVDQELLTEKEDGRPNISNSSSFREVKIACIASILQVGICCSEEAPMDRVLMQDALKELEAIRDKFPEHVLNEGATSPSH